MEEVYSDSLVREKVTPDVLRRLAYGITYSCFSGFALGETLGMVAGTIWELSFVSILIIANIISFVFGYVFSLFPLLALNISFKKAVFQALISDVISLVLFEIITRSIFFGIPGANSSPVTSLLYWQVFALAVVVSFAVALPINIFITERRNFIIQNKQII